MPTSDPSPSDLRRTLLACALGLGVGAFIPKGARAALLSSPAASDTGAIEVFGADGKSKGTVTVPRVVKTGTDGRRQPSLLAYTVTRIAGTELTFDFAYHNNT